MPFSALATALAKPAAFIGFFSQVDFATCSVFLVSFNPFHPPPKDFFLTNVDMPKGSKRIMLHRTVPHLKEGCFPGNLCITRYSEFRWNCQHFMRPLPPFKPRWAQVAFRPAIFNFGVGRRGCESNSAIARVLSAPRHWGRLLEVDWCPAFTALLNI